MEQYLDENLEPWEQQPWESDKQYKAFQIFLDLGINRTVLDAYRIYSNNPNAAKSAKNFTYWSNRNLWLQRSRAWNNFVLKKKAEETQKKFAELAAEIAEAEVDYRRRIAEITQRALDKIEQMLKFPLVQQKTERDGKTIIIEPVNWSLGNAASLLSAITQIADKNFMAMGAKTVDDMDEERIDTEDSMAKVSDKRLNEIIRMAEDVLLSE